MMRFPASWPYILKSDSNFSSVTIREIMHEFYEVNNVCPLIKSLHSPFGCTKHYCVLCIYCVVACIVMSMVLHVFTKA